MPLLHPFSTIQANNSTTAKVRCVPAGKAWPKNEPAIAGGGAILAAT